MSNLQIKGIEESLYTQIRELAVRDQKRGRYPLNLFSIKG